MCKRSQEGTALILALLFTMALAAVGSSMLVLTRTETMASQNYRMLTQARYGAESGVHKAINYLTSAYPKPGTATDPLSNYDTTTSPVQWNGAPVVLSTMAGVATRYPDSAVAAAFAQAGRGSLTAGNATVQFTTSAVLRSMRVVNGEPVMTWQITSDGTIVGVRGALVEVTASLEKQVTATPNTVYAAFATSPNCGALTWSSATTDSYDSTAGLVGGRPVLALNGGNVGTNGNLNANNSATVRGSLSTPRVGVGACSAGNVDAQTSSGGAAVTGGIIHLPQAISQPTPPLPSPVPNASQNITVTDVSNCPAALAGCSKSGGDKTFQPGTYGNITLTDTARLHLKAGTYNINSFSIDNSSRIILDTSPVIINVMGTNKAQPFWLNSSVSTDPSRPWDPKQLQILYAGSGTIRIDNQATSVAQVNAPNAAVVVNSSDYYGSIIGRTVTFGNAAKLHFDRNLGSSAAMTYAVGADVLTAFSWKKY